MRIAVVYDCLYPHTVGGAERWYRNLAERLADDDHEVTYLTLRQWPRGTDPGVPGVNVVPVGPRMQLYTGSRRRILPPLVFGCGLLAHLIRHGGRYDVVHTAAFPYFSLLAAWAAQRLRGHRLIVDWVEVWTGGYWREYLGPVAGRVGGAVQHVCARIGDRAFCFSRLHAERLRREGFRRQITVLEGIYAGPRETPEPGHADPLVVFAGRHIPEKRVTAIPAAIAIARRTLPELRCVIYGDGPEREMLLRQILAQDIGDAVDAPGFVSGDEVDRTMRLALCMLLPSRREGYGLVVVEASARATPSVVVLGPDNAATELVREGENGVVADSASPEALAAAIVRVHEAGHDLRVATAGWFSRNAERLSIESSLDTVAQSYRSGSTR